MKKLENVEVIISDYGSTDNIKQVCKDFGFKYIYTEPEPNVDFSISKCHNNGIYHAKGEYIVVMGTDIIISQDFDKTATKFFNSMKEDLVYLVQVFHFNEKTYELFPMRSLWRWVPIFKKEHAITCGGYDERFTGWGHEDVDFIQRIKKKIHVELYILIDTLCLHIWHGKEHSDAAEFQEGGNPNKIFYKENRENNSKNMVNSYW